MKQELEDPSPSSDEKQRRKTPERGENKEEEVEDTCKVVQHQRQRPMKEKLKRPRMQVIMPTKKFRFTVLDHPDPNILDWILREDERILPMF